MEEKEILEIRDCFANLMDTSNKQSVRILSGRLLELLSPILDKAEKRIENSKLGFEARYVDEDYLKDAAKAYAVLAEINGSYNNAESELQFFDREMGDILHGIELLDEEVFDENEYTKKLRLNRINRRKAKDFMQVAKPLFDLMNKQHAVQFRKDLNIALTEMRKENKRLETRTYTPRELTSLEAAFAKVSNAYDALKVKEGQTIQ
jgi:hypothetical protein